MTGTNKWLLICKSHGNLNRCTPYRENPDQHFTCFPRSIHVWFKTIRISRGSHIATFHAIINSDGQSHCSWEKELPTQSTTRRLTDSRVHTQFLSRASHWSNGCKVTLYWQQITRPTGPINTSMRSVHSILARGANSLVLNRLRRGLQPWRCRLSTYCSPTFPTGSLHFPLKGPAPVSSLTKF
jgi:hypothetical protein